MSATRLTVPLGARAYDLVIAPGLLDRCGDEIGHLLPGRRAILVTDANLAATPHPARVERSLEAAGLAVERVVVPAGESAKAMAGLAELCERILALGIDRKTAIIAVGGGVVGDLAGFAAAVLLRGLPFIQVPTTLLAQVDSSVGGKTGVNSRHGKNLIGAFHQPRLVLIDPTTLIGLPGRELRAGYAELVKHAFIRDFALFEWLEAELARVMDQDPEALGEAIARSVAVKVAIVGEDEHETLGVRALLNFGHTFAHAYETLDGYSERLRHGEAVAIGMAAAFDLSVRLGLCPGQDRARAVAHLARSGLPTELAALGLGFDEAAVVAAMRKDKKADGAGLTFIVSHGIGRAGLHREASSVSHAPVA